MDRNFLKEPPLGLNVTPALGEALNDSGRLTKVWLPIALFCILWADLIRQLSTQWEAREQYAYGWFVPLFAAGLLWRRWCDRPPAGPRGTPMTLTLPVIMAALAMLPMRVIYEINPDWPLLAWIYTLFVVVGTLYAFFLAGGLAWTKHIAFPVAFILVAVIWPWRIEKGLTQGLMQVVAALTVELLGWLDVPALHRGNLIELSTGVVGIDEACSGIRSFQSTLMAGLLMGELYRLRLWARATLIVCGFVLAFCLNIVRTLLLSWQVSHHGLGALEKWHDPAGLTITVVCVFGLWMMAGLIKSMRRASEVTGRTAASGPKEALVHKAGNDPNSPISPSLGDLSSSVGVPSAFQSRVPRRYLVAAGCWAICIIVATEAWYRSHETQAQGIFHWAVNLPTNNPTFQEIELAPRSVHLLGYDLAATGKWQNSDGSQWSAYFLRWMPRSIQSVIMSRIHRPDRCLPAAGMEQVADAGIKYFTVGFLKLPFRRYTYELDGKPIHVFFCQWEDGSENQMGLMGSNQTDRLRSVLVGRRKLGNQTFEVMVSGYATLDQADQAFTQLMGQIIRLEDRPPAS